MTKYKLQCDATVLKNVKFKYQNSQQNKHYQRQILGQVNFDIDLQDSEVLQGINDSSWQNIMWPDSSYKCHVSISKFTTKPKTQTYQCQINDKLNFDI